MRNKEVEDKVVGMTNEIHGKYMCFVEGGKSPTVFHEGISAAQDEAKRLAAKESGKRVIIMRCMAVVLSYPSFAWGFAPEEDPDAAKQPERRVPLHCPACD